MKKPAQQTVQYFGIQIRYHQLVRAACVFQSFYRSTIIIDVLFNRLARPGGTVRFQRRAASRTNLASLPLEIILLIKSYLIQDLLDQSEDKFMDNHLLYFSNLYDEKLDALCRSCYQPHSIVQQMELDEVKGLMEMEKNCTTWSPGMKVGHDERADWGTCRVCLRLLSDWENKNLQTLIKRFVQYHGLHIQTDPRMIKTNSRTKSVFITLPSGISQNNLPSPTGEKVKKILSFRRDFLLDPVPLESKYFAQPGSLAPSILSGMGRCILTLEETIQEKERSFGIMDGRELGVYPAWLNISSSDTK
ncbi:hypothetical protein T439DRAFT_382603 [Meredithblackwellia eburnea MCA 4105]